jgi:hypothetical protein
MDYRKIDFDINETPILIHNISNMFKDFDDDETDDIYI